MFNKWRLEKEFTDMLEKFTTMLEAQQIERLEHHGLACPANIEGARVTASIGKRYAKVMVGSSVRYFVAMYTYNIYASASRTVPNRNRFFGTLHTIADFNWGAYEAFAKPGTPWQMTPTRGGYFTAVTV